MYICIDTAFSLVCVYICTRTFIFYIEDLVACLRRIPVVCSHINFNLQREKHKSFSELFSRDALLHLFDKDFKALQ